MPDITMCKGKGCKTKYTCYRFTAEPGYRQSYFKGSPIENNGCDYYWSKNNGQKLNPYL
jgi:hypothetical protein